jgi:alkylation response protein AidB-like acyl-CoA dehydrogenase
VDFSFSSEQDDLRREARAFLEANPSPSMEQLHELGWVGILRNSSSEDSDFTFLDAAVIFEELGRALYAGPYVLNEIAGQPGDDVWSIEIDGFVPHLDQVTRVLTADMQAAGATGETLATVDESLGLGKLSLNGAEPAEGSWDGVRRRLLAALALESIGIGSKVTEMALEYVSGREQFGKKIGTYQAISHSLVDAYVAVELSRSLAYWAAWSVAESDAQVDMAVAAAKSQAAEAAVLACEKSIQAHGGIGFTWEHPLHRYYKRALWLEGALGYGREHRAAIAASLLAG